MLASKINPADNPIAVLLPENIAGRLEASSPARVAYMIVGISSLLFMKAEPDTSRFLLYTEGLAGFECVIPVCKFHKKHKYHNPLKSRTCEFAYSDHESSCENNSAFVCCEFFSLRDDNNIAHDVLELSFQVQTNRYTAREGQAWIQEKFRFKLVPSGAALSYDMAYRIILGYFNLA
jgi:uncharacterized membrane protein YuzA (DUF378 family)